MREQANIRKSRSATLEYGGAFGLRVISARDDVILVELSGELDVISMERFEGAIADLLSGHPNEVVFDLTQSEFVCAQAYSVMGRCCSVAKVTVRSTSELSARVLAVYGHEDVVVLTEPEARRYAAR